jgi:hypothetical protein
MALTWHQETMGVCPHGFAARPYCATCGIEDKAAEAAQKAEHGARERVVELEKTAAKQSAALDAAYSHIRQVEKRQRHVRRRGR